MNHNAYQAALDRLELTQVEAAELLGVDGRTSRRWAAPPRVKSARGIPFSVGLLLQLMQMDRLKPWQIEAAQKKGPLNYRTLRAAMKELGLSMADTADLFAVGDRTINRWAAPTQAEGARGVPASISILMHLMLMGYVKPRHIDTAKRELQDA